MKKNNIILMIFLLFSINSMYAQKQLPQQQQSLALVLDCANASSLYPSTTEILAEFQIEEDKRNSPNYHAVEWFEQRVGTKMLLASDIPNLRPILFLKVSPDTINQTLTYKLDTDGLEFWRNDGYTFPYKYAILNYGNHWEMPYKAIIGNLPVNTCMFFVYFLKNRVAYHYLVYKNSGGNIVFVARNGTTYDSLEEIVNQDYGGFAEYAKKYYPKKQKVYVRKNGIVIDSLWINMN